LLYADIFLTGLITKTREIIPAFLRLVATWWCRWNMLQLFRTGNFPVDDFKDRKGFPISGFGICLSRLGNKNLFYLVAPCVGFLLW